MSIQMKNSAEAVAVWLKTESGDDYLALLKDVTLESFTDLVEGFMNEELQYVHTYQVDSGDPKFDKVLSELLSLKIEDLQTEDYADE